MTDRFSAVLIYEAPQPKHCNASRMSLSLFAFASFFSKMNTMLNFPRREMVNVELFQERDDECWIFPGGRRPFAASLCFLIWPTHRFTCCHIYFWPSETAGTAVLVSSSCTHIYFEQNNLAKGPWLNHSDLRARVICKWRADLRDQFLPGNDGHLTHARHL